MILAAGLGTRLMPLTTDTPKALIRINGITLLELAVKKLSSEGFNDIIVNVHHHAPIVREFLANHKFPGVNIEISDETELLLDTGGGILKARWFLDGTEPFVVYNVDIITNFSLKALWQAHGRSRALATIAVSMRKTSRYFLFNRSGLLCGWMDTKTGSTRWSSEPNAEANPLAFSGIHIIDPAIFNLISETGRFSIVDTYIRLAASHPISAFDHTGTIWFDLGKPEQIAIVEQYLLEHPEFPAL